MELLKSFKGDHAKQRYVHKLTDMVKRVVPILPNGGKLSDYEVIRLPAGDTVGYVLLDWHFACWHIRSQYCR